jgi:hypothetical protein
MSPGTSRPVFCRACARDSSLRIDGEWRHDDDGTVACVNPDTLYGITRDEHGRPVAAAN